MLRGGRGNSSYTNFTKILAFGEGIPSPPEEIKHVFCIRVLGENVFSTLRVWKLWFEFIVTVYKIDKTTFSYRKYNYISIYINGKVYK